MLIRKTSTNGYFTLAFSRAQMWVEWLDNPYLLGHPQCSAWRKKIRIGYFTLAFSWAQIWAEGLHNRYLLGGPQCIVRGKTQKRPISRRNGNIIPTGQDGYITLAFSGSLVLSTRKKSELATSPLPSRGGRTGLKWLHNPCRLGVPSARHMEKIRKGPNLGGMAA